VRETVRRYSGCLGELPLREARVLVLRAGIGPGPALSRARTGDRLDIPTRRVARLERRGLRHLRAAAADGCGGGAAGRTIAETVLAALGGGDGGAAAAVGAGISDAASGGARTGGSGGSAQGGSGVKGEFESSDDDGGSGRPAVSVPPVTADEGGTTAFSIAALLLGLLMLGYAVRRELRAGGPPAAG
jgi:hypothetical protein